MQYILFAQLHPLDVRVLVIVTAMPREDGHALDAFSLSGIAPSEHHAQEVVRTLIEAASEKVRTHGGVVVEIREP